MSDFVDLAKNNADLTRWRWDDGEKAEWEKAPFGIQRLYDQWRNASKKTELKDEVRIGKIPRIPNVPERFLIRSAYVSLFDRVWKRGFKLVTTGVVVTGQPGVGKTIFLWYSLIRLFMEQQPVAFLTGGFVYLFYGGEAYCAPAETARVIFPFANPDGDDEEPQPFLWSLIDHDSEFTEPLAALHTGLGVFPIQAVTPNPERYGHWAKRRYAAIWGLDLWNEAELIEALPLQIKYRAFKAALLPYISPSSEPSSEKYQVSGYAEACGVLDQWRIEKARLLEEVQLEDGAEIEEDIFRVDITTADGAFRVLIHNAIREYGLIARDVFMAIFLPKVIRTARDESLKKVTYRHLRDLVKTFRYDTVFPDKTISHYVVSVSPVGEIHYTDQRNIWALDFRTVHSAKEAIHKLEQEHGCHLGDVYSLFRTSSQSSALASWILVPISHRHLRTSKRQDLIMCKMDGELNTDAPVLDVDFSTAEAVMDTRLPSGEREIMEFNRARLERLSVLYYYVPDRVNHPFYDAFMIEQQSSTATSAELILWVFQMSTVSSHGGSREGYVSVRNIIGSLKTSFEAKDQVGKKTKLQKLTVNVKVNYVYVVPLEDDRCRWQWRLPGGWKKNVIRNDHRGDFYCLRMPIPIVSGVELT